MYAEVEIGLALLLLSAVPDSAVIDTGTRQVVILDRGEAVSSRGSEDGLRGGGFTEFAKGCRGRPGRRRGELLIDAVSNLKRAARSDTPSAAMIARLIGWSPQHVSFRRTVFAVAAASMPAHAATRRHPDLSTSGDCLHVYPGQAPQWSRTSSPIRSLPR